MIQSLSQQKQTVQPSVPLVEVWRGPVVESRHRGHVVAVDGDGKIVAQLGGPETITYLRSSAKPHQAFTFVSAGAGERFGFTDKEIAVACGSHSGEPIHEETVAAMLRKINLPANALKCGVHEPFSREAAQELKMRGEHPRILQNNCSGKHTGMLALALHLNAPVETYDQPDNPAQLKIKEAVARFSTMPVEEIAVGVDGCGVPVFGMPLKAMALMYARLVAPPADFSEHERAACERVVASMTTHPEMVGGATERLDTEIMRAAPGVISKVGAEGVYLAGVKPCAEWPRGLGLALKVEDGEDRRARPTVVIESLRQLHVLSEASLTVLAPYTRFAVRNHRGEEVGEVRPHFTLQMD